MKNISLRLLYLVVMLVATSSSYAITVTGQVVNGSSPLCALVLANGAHAFSCTGDGRFSIDAPLDSEGLMTVQTFAFGHAPTLQSVKADQAQNMSITMGTVQYAPVMIVDYDVTKDSVSSRHRFKGSIKDQGTGAPVCALVLLNGNYMFSCGESQGAFDITSFESASGEMELMVFAAGFLPYNSRIQSEHDGLLDYSDTSCGRNMELGSPYPSEFILCHDIFSIGYNSKTKNPDWVQYRLTSTQVNASPDRTGDYRSDDNLYPSEQASSDDYRYSGYDRGHMAPAGSVAYDYNSMSTTFLMTNISPQDRTFNAGLWNNIESYVRDIVNEYESVYVVTGPAGITPFVNEIGNGVKVPPYFFKAIIHPHSKKGMAFWVPNTPSSDKNVCKYATSIDYVEQQLGQGFDLFPHLSNDVESTIEKKLEPMIKCPSTYTPLPSYPTTPTLPSFPTTSDPRCINPKTTCKAMRDCDDAKFYFYQCGISRLDGDKDGTPCEGLCR